MKYRVLTYETPASYNDDHDTNLHWATMMREEYGLYRWTSAEIQHQWEAYSESMAAGWMVDDKESIERVFGVTLEEMK